MKHIFSILLLLTTLTIYSQSIQEFNGKALLTDQFGYYYEIKDNEIKKYINTGQLYYTYSNNVLGVISNVDVTNPYKVVVYFNDFTKIVILDNMLSPASDVVDLTTINQDETSLVCRSYNDAFWYYNFIQFKLTRVNHLLEETNNSGNIATLLGKNIQPNFMVEYNNKVYLNDPKHGILVFDIYGTYLKTIPIYGLEQFQVKEKYIVYVNNSSQIERYDFFTLEKEVYDPEKYQNIQLVRIENKLIYAVDKNHRLIIDKIYK
ncbi:MAG: hypothetical protein J5I47_04145 [Vicingus serpentipes]|nr:hypothetical protein [Vicingus serpentipes]